MAYVTYAEFKTYSPLSPIQDDDEFLVLSEAASAVVDRLTMTKIILLGGLSVFSAFTQERIKKATSAQINTIYDQGGTEALTGTPSAITGGVTIGRYSESGGGSNKSGVGNGIQVIDSIPVSPMVKMYLQPTNLLNRAINRSWSLSDIL